MSHGTRPWHCTKGTASEELHALSTRAGHLQMPSSAWLQFHRSEVQQVCMFKGHSIVGAGTIEEKIFQRQLSKQELAFSMESTAGSKVQQAKFTREELKALFTLHTNTACDTADLLSPTDKTWEVQSAHEL